MPKDRSKKVLKYIKQNRPAKLKSFVKKHKIDLLNMHLPSQKTLLHFCCQSKRILRYLLKNGVDVNQRDVLGNLPLHDALYQALTSQSCEQSNTVYTETILPLLECYPECLEVKNLAGTTPRHLLDLLVKKKERERNQQEQVHSSGSIVEKTSWEDKLADEMEDEYNTTWGEYEEDYFCGREEKPETYDEWAERIQSQYTHKHQYGKTNMKASTSRRTKTEVDDDAEKLCQIRQKLERQYKVKEKQLKADDLKSQQRSYQEKYQTLLNKTTGEPLGFGDIPWPCKGDMDSILRIMFAGVEESNKDAYRRILREEQVKWHPDKFMQKFGCMLGERERKKIVAKVNEISQTLNGLAENIESINTKSNS